MFNRRGGNNSREPHVIHSESNNNTRGKQKYQPKSQHQYDDNHNNSHNNYNNNKNHSYGHNSYDNRNNTYKSSNNYNQYSTRNTYDNYSNSNSNSNRYTSNSKSYTLDSGSSEKQEFQWRPDGRCEEELSGEMKTYFKRAQKSMERDSFTSDIERSQFIESVLQESVNAIRETEEQDEDEENKKSPEEVKKRKEAAYAEFLTTLNSPMSSRIIQQLCEVAAPQHLRFFVKYFKYKMVLIATGKFSSFILQSILERAPAILEEEIKEQQNNDHNNEEQDEDEEDAKVPLLMQIIKWMRQEFKGHLSDLIVHPQATFIIRAYVKTALHLDREGLSNKYRKLASGVVEEVLRGSKFPEWIPYSSGIASLATFLECIPGTHKTHTAIVKFIFGIDQESKFDASRAEVKTAIIKLISKNETTHLLQAIIKTASEDTRNDLYAFVFRNQLKEYAMDRNKSFVAEDLIKYATHKEQFELMMQELEPHFAEIWNGKTRNVLIALAEGCVKFDCKQKEFIKEITKAFNASSKGEERPKLVYNLLYNAPEPPSSPVLDRFGCLLTAAMLKFGAQQLVVILSSFIAMDNKLFADLCCEKNGSLVAEALVLSKPAQTSTKYKIIKKLKGQYARLAKDKFGSHVIEKCMFVCEAKKKKRIAAELVADEKQMRNCKFGIIIWNKCFLTKFKQDADQWLGVEDQNQRRKEMFKEIIEDKPVVQNADSDVEMQEKPKKQSANKPKSETKDPLMTSSKNKKKSSMKLLNVDLFAKVGNKRKRDESNLEEEQPTTESGVANLGFISQAIKKLKK